MTQTLNPKLQQPRAVLTCTTRAKLQIKRHRIAADIVICVKEPLKLECSYLLRACAFELSVINNPPLYSVSYILPEFQDLGGCVTGRRFNQSVLIRKLISFYIFPSGLPTLKGCCHRRSREACHGEAAPSAGTLEMFLFLW